MSECFYSEEAPIIEVTRVLGASRGDMRNHCGNILSFLVEFIAAGLFDKLDTVVNQLFLRFDFRIDFLLCLNNISYFTLASYLFHILFVVITLPFVLTSVAATGLAEIAFLTLKANL